MLGLSSWIGRLIRCLKLATRLTRLTQYSALGSTIKSPNTNHCDIKQRTNFNTKLPLGLFLLFFIFKPPQITKPSANPTLQLWRPTLSIWPLLLYLRMRRLLYWFPLSLTIKIKERFLSPIIGIGYLVLGTHSAAKFEKFPSTTKYTITTFIGLVFGWSKNLSFYCSKKKEAKYGITENHGVTQFCKRMRGQQELSCCAKRSFA